MSMLTGTEKNVTELTKVGPSAFSGVLWAGVSTSFLLVVCRYYIRLKVFRRLLIDDAFVLLAWLMLLANAITCELAKDHLYLVLSVGAARQRPPDFLRHVDRLRHTQLASGLLFLFSLWCIKFSFIAFFYKLGEKIKRQMILWWGVLIFNVACLIVCVGIRHYKCMAISARKNLAECSNDWTYRYQHNANRATSALDVLTDIAILLLPIRLLKNVQISLRQKLALGAILSLTAFVMAIAIIRINLITEKDRRADLTWFWTWNAVEQSVAVIIACLVSFRAFFTQRSGSQKRQYNGYMAEQAEELPQYSRAGRTMSHDSMTQKNLFAHSEKRSVGPSSSSLGDHDDAIDPEAI